MTDQDKLARIIEALRDVIAAVSTLADGAEWKRSVIMSQLHDAEESLNDIVTDPAIDDLLDDSPTTFHQQTPHPVDCLCDGCYDIWKGVCPGCYGTKFKAFAAMMDGMGDYSCFECHQVWRTKRDENVVRVVRMNNTRDLDKRRRL